MLTKTKTAFGQLLLNVSEKLRTLSEKFGTGVTGLVSTKKSRVLIWDIIDGPYHRSEFQQSFLDENGIDEDSQYMLVVKLEEDGKIGQVNFWYETEEEVLAVKEYFLYNIEPLEVQE